MKVQDIVKMVLATLHTVFSPLSGIVLAYRFNTSVWMLFSSKQY